MTRPASLPTTSGTSSQSSFFSVRLLISFCLLALMPGSQGSDTYSDAWAPAAITGAEVPEISARDQFGQSQSLQSLMGEKGLLFLFSRSVSW